MKLLIRTIIGQVSLVSSLFFGTSSNLHRYCFALLGKAGQCNPTAMPESRGLCEESVHMQLSKVQTAGSLSRVDDISEALFEGSVEVSPNQADRDSVVMISEYSDRDSVVMISEYVDYANVTVLACVGGKSNLEHFSVHIFGSNYSTNSSVFYSEVYIVTVVRSCVYLCT